MGRARKTTEAGPEREIDADGSIAVDVDDKNSSISIQCFDTLPNCYHEITDALIDIRDKHEWARTADMIGIKAKVEVILAEPELLGSRNRLIRLLMEKGCRVTNINYRVGGRE